jgi:hypothetical protein
MQLVVQIEPKPQGHLVIGSIIARIAKQVKDERLDRGDFTLRAPVKGKDIDYHVTWGLWP